jgi:hypothetical protein
MENEYEKYINENENIFKNGYYSFIDEYIEVYGVLKKKHFLFLLQRLINSEIIENYSIKKMDVVDLLVEVILATIYSLSILKNNSASASLRLVNPRTTLPPALFHIRNELPIAGSFGLASVSLNTDDFLKLPQPMLYARLTIASNLF